MATKPEEITLNEENRRRIASLANRRGREWKDVLSELIESAEAVLGIQEGLQSLNRGEGRSAKDVHRELRDKNELE